MDEVVPMSPSGAPPTLPEIERPGAERLSLQDRVDDVERRMGMALKCYRQAAEEILDEHFHTMEMVQVHHDHELAVLKVENAKLRELASKVGIPSAGIGGEPVQQVLFQSMATAPEFPLTSKAKKNNLKQGRNDDDDMRPMNKQKTKKLQQAEQDRSGGTWQSFMAWVPSGSTVLNPEPWKPLPGLQSDSSFTKASKAMAGGDCAVALPGGVSDDALKQKSNEAGDDEDSDKSDELEGDELQKLELAEVWKPTEKEKKRKRRSSGELESRCDSETDEYNAAEEKKPRFIMNPDSGMRIAWDLSSLFMVVYDMISIPLSVFTMPEHIFLTMMDWTTRVFWTVDMGWSCCTGVVLADGTIDYNFKSILKRYCKSWLSLDCFIVGSDWAGFFLSAGGMGLSRLARISRIARVVRLLRLVRMQEVIANITERIQSDNTMLGLQIVKLFIFLIAICHVTACGWWSCGSITSGTSWITTYGYANQDVGHQYLMCLHWALSQFSGGIEELPPTSTLERFYTVSTWVLSFISCMVMLSFLTSSLTQQYIIGGSGARQMATLKKYLNQNKIPKNLIKRLCRSAKHAISGDLQPESVDLMHVVSEPLKMEMHFEMYSRLLCNHPFFADFFARGDQVMRRVCHSCMSMLLLDSGDVLFRRGDEPAEGRMYFVFSGILEYVDKYHEKHKVLEKAWLSEAALWSTWKHQGVLTAITDAKLAVLDSDGFQEVVFAYMKKSRSSGFNPKIYAQQFIDGMNTCDTEWSDLAMD